LDVETGMTMGKRSGSKLSSLEVLILPGVEYEYCSRGSLACRLQLFAE
jgi:hypothetical protein